ncbi:MAG: metallophosphoesterase [Labilithrix sp.]|nr:metallophosphoesterase [Labilithrix sp.]MCW5816747.1 metallophosphoesterase [Labilithrix sp.]
MTARRSAGKLARVRRRWRALSVLVTLAALHAGCEGGVGPGAEEQEAEQRGVPELSPRSARPAASRVVAIGDLHGDVGAARRALRMAGAIGDGDSWIGGDLVVVQTGDQIDRGADDRAVLDLFTDLAKDAKSSGGEVIALAGNHEIMNAMFDFRYVAPEAYAPFDGFTPTGPAASRAARFGDEKRGRASAFAPGGVYASILAERPLVVRVGDSVFAHGGVHLKHATYGIDRINDGVREWLAGRAAEPPAIAVADDGPIWTRAYSDGTVTPSACATLTQTLSKLHASRLVMGHTIQEGGISSACDGEAWRIDVGMSEAYGGDVEVLEIAKGDVRVLRGP